jgi:hypothetical protein
MIRFSAAAALAILAIFSVTTSWGAEQAAQKKPPAKVGSTEAQKSTAQGVKGHSFCRVPSPWRA